MCMGKAPKAPAATPPPAPAPIPTPTETSPLGAEDTRRKRVESMRYGLASTIKTSARGITGAGADLTSAGLEGKKNKLGG
jgi:hypothetical protein